MTDNERICAYIQQGQKIALELLDVVTNLHGVKRDQSNILALYSEAEELRDVLNYETLSKLLEMYKAYEQLRKPLHHQ